MKRIHDIKPESLRYIIQQMCYYANVSVEDVDFDKYNWFNSHTWTIKQEEGFKNWLYNYLYYNRIARREVFGGPTRPSKRTITRGVDEFVFMYGWSVIDQPSQDDTRKETSDGSR